MGKIFRRTQDFSGTLYVSIPSASKKAMGLSKGDYVSIEFLNNKIIIEPVNPVCKTDSQASHSPTVKEGAA